MKVPDEQAGFAHTAVANHHQLDGYLLLGCHESINIILSVVAFAYHLRIRISHIRHH